MAIRMARLSWIICHFGLLASDPLILKRASTSRASGDWNDDDFDMLVDGAAVGRIFKAAASPVGTPWMWTLGFGHHKDRTPTHGYEATREAAIAAFPKSWRREQAMAKPTIELSAQDKVILFCVAIGIDHAAVGILVHAMQSMAIRGFIAHNRESGAYTLTDSGRATLAAILENAGLK
jgi:hypothetical protein